MPILTEEQQKIVRQILAQYLPHEEIWIIGSRVAGPVKPHSDLDLVIKEEQTIHKETMALLKDAFSESALPFKVDVIEWATTSQNFQAIILQRYEVFQKRGEARTKRCHE